MPSIITLEEAQAKLGEIIDQLAPGSELIITSGNRVVARLIRERTFTRPRPAPGLGKGDILYIAPDFDEPMEEFRHYTE